ncbi:MAG: type VI secretion system tube protein Hcp [Limisphaerales bacterium]
MTGMKTLMLLLAAGVWLVGAHDVTAQTLLMKLDPASGLDFTGDSVLSGHAGEINVSSFSLGLANPAAVGGGGSGTPEFSDITIEKPVDRSSVSLASACAMGAVIPKGRIFMLKTSGGGGGSIPVLYEVGFEDGFVTGVSVSGANGDGPPTESVSIKFTKVTWTYYPQSGANTDPITKGWDVEHNVSYDTKIE